jgi:FkbM family methyltransferase
MSIRQKLIALFPARLELAARYNYNRIAGKLEREMRIIGSLTARRRRSVDVGANVGLYTYCLAKLFERVESFEPIPQCARVIASSRLKNVRLHTCALSNRAGDALLHIPVEEGPHATGLASLSRKFSNAVDVPVALRTLDSFGFRELDLIKIDVEGHELEVLQGARETIARERPALLVEVEKRHHPDRDIQEIFDFLLALGYDGCFFCDEKMHPLQSFAPERHQQGLDPLDRKHYVNNFIFRPLAQG